MEEFELEVLLRLEKFLDELDKIWLEYKQQLELDRAGR